MDLKTKAERIARKIIQAKNSNKPSYNLYPQSPIAESELWKEVVKAEMEYWNHLAEVNLERYTRKK